MFELSNLNTEIINNWKEIRQKYNYHSLQDNERFTYFYTPDYCAKKTEVRIEDGRDYSKIFLRENVILSLTKEKEEKFFKRIFRWSQK